MRKSFQAAEVCTTIITVIFGLVAVAHSYKALGTMDKPQPGFGRNIAVLSGLIWAAGASYFIIQLYLIVQSSDVQVRAFVAMVRYFSVVDLVMTLIWLIGAGILTVLCLLRIIKGSLQAVDPYRAAVASLCDQPETIVCRL